MCNCWSVGLDGPFAESGRDAPAMMKDVHGRLIAVDACIADAVRTLIENGVETLSSCCGHNGRFEKAPGPSIVVGNPEQYDKAREVLNNVGESRIGLYAWVFTDLDTL